ncbi:hypothetical protein FRZ61_34630 [Hypericibacter adhaerens]|uniref:DUF6468 domain-containing protein n=1 Tax=Hypericibacter adhaerens TaxID=2602016 RepID=A0A5J6N3E7_9PROT|nr:DUF6468 domain-containing protein [Hypericibacter adhaerens]QEX23525.1 hypothetical protein FRZ61_34630 [Hypericibacter adhaerens]
MFDLSIPADLAKFLTLPMAFDAGLVLLLGATLLFVARLNRRIGELKRERTHFDAAIERFAGAAAETQRAMAELRRMAEGEGKVIQEQVKKGAGIADDLEFLIGRATAAADRLETVIGKARPIEARQNETRATEPRAAELHPQNAEARESAAAKDTPRMAARDLAKATPLARAFAGDPNDLVRGSASRGGPATVTRRPMPAETLPESGRALLKALAGLR